MWTFRKRKTSSSPAPIQAALKAMEDAHQFNEDIDVIVKFGEVLEKVCSGTMSKGNLPTLEDLPYPIERIEEALNRCLKSSEVPVHLKQAALGSQQFLQLFKMGSNQQNTEPAK